MKAHLFLALKIAISITSLALLARSVSWQELAHSFRALQPGWVLLALAIFWAAQFASSLRCAYIARRLGGTLDLATSVRAHFLGLWFNQVLPTSLGGDVIKIAVLRKKIGLGLALRAAILDRISGLVFLMLALALTLPLYARIFPRTEFTAAIALLSLGFMVALPVLCWGARHVSARFAHRPQLVRLLQLLVDIGSFRQGRALWEQAWTSAIVHFNGIAAYGLLGVALGIKVHLVLFVLVVPLVFLVALLPLSFAGWGVREAGAVWLFGMVGIGKEDALAMSVCFGLMLVMAGLPGLWVFMRQPAMAPANPAAGPIHPDP